MSLRILVVDDDRDCADSIADLLELRGYGVTVAGGGREALDRMAEADFDVTFLDIRMPGMDGMQSLKAIRTLNPRAEVVMMTAYANGDYLSEATAAGARTVINKPLDLQRTLELLNDLHTDFRVFVVDEDGDFAGALAELLRGEAFEVEVITSGVRAVDRIARHPHGLLITDFCLSDLAGADIVEQLEQRGIRIPVIVIAAHADAQLASLSRLAGTGLAGVLTKPFDTAALLAMVGRAQQSAIMRPNPR